ncbi:hypothetical protein AK812_SmicGene10584 [Symbiodinium microadriaticum]|uniref:Uncharacterized protein n=1 Tax=Symbiodinium microadriaticum TaxID=2951 RepID=A0A1Q9EFH6_SYMMI|nr:hypothetical protein AK812_SmicGene10584 [Symbiodinium microadriaticum]
MAKRPEKEPSKDGSWQLLGWRLAAGVSTLTAGNEPSEYPSSCTGLSASFQRRFCAARARAGESPLLHEGLSDQEHTFAFPPQAEMQLATAKWRTLRRVARHPHSCAIFKADLRAEHSSGLRGIVLACQWRWAGSGSGKEFEAVEHMHPFSGPKQQVKSIRLEFVWHEALCSAPLRAATVVGPGDSADAVQVQAETHRWGVMTTVLSLDCLDDGFFNQRAWGEEEVLGWQRVEISLPGRLICSLLLPSGERFGGLRGFQRRFCESPLLHRGLSDQIFAQNTALGFVALCWLASGGVPLRAASVVGPGDSADTVQVQSEAPRWGVMTAILSVDCLDDGFLKEKGMG